MSRMSMQPFRWSRSCSGSKSAENSEAAATRLKTAGTLSE